MTARKVTIKPSPEAFDLHDVFVDGHKAASFWFLRDVRQIEGHNVVKCTGELTHTNGTKERLDQFVSFADACYDLRYRFNQGIAP